MGIGLVIATALLISTAGLQLAYPLWRRVIEKDSDLAFQVSAPQRARTNPVVAPSTSMRLVAAGLS
jgi:hypothetical protein